jgi:hypothetical protein
MFSGNACARDAGRAVDTPGRLERHRRGADAGPDAEAVADVDEGALARMIALHSATVDGPICSAAANRRAGVQKAYRRCALGMCSGIVVWRCFTGERAWLATRTPRWNISAVCSGAYLYPVRLCNP